MAFAPAGSDNFTELAVRVVRSERRALRTNEDPIEGKDSLLPVYKLRAERGSSNIVLTFETEDKTFTPSGIEIQVGIQKDGPWYAPIQSDETNDWRSTTEDTWYAATTAGDTWVHTNVPSDTTLYYRVRAFNSETGDKGRWSNTASAIATDDSLTAGNINSPEPEKPTLTAVGVLGNVILSWGQQDNLLNYLGAQIQVAESANGPWYKPDVIGGDTTWRGNTRYLDGVNNEWLEVGGYTWTHPSVPNQLLYYRIRIFTSVEDDHLILGTVNRASPWSDAVSVKSSVDLEAPVLMAVGSSGDIILTWDKQEELIFEVGTEIQVAEANNGPWYSPLTGTSRFTEEGISDDWKDTLNAWITVSSHTWTHTDIPLVGDIEQNPMQRELFYRVRRVDRNNNKSSWSNIASARAGQITLASLPGLVNVGKVNPNMFDALGISGGNLLAHWAFDETITGMSPSALGEFRDQLDNANPLKVVSNTVTTAKGTIKNAASFSGVTASVARTDTGIGTSGSNWENVSIAFWMKPLATQPNTAVTPVSYFAGTTEFYVVFRSDNTQRLDIKSGSSIFSLLTTNATNVFDNQWHFVFISYNGNTKTGKIYIDAILKEEGILKDLSDNDSTVANIPQNGNFSVGGAVRGGSAGGNINGAIDEVRFLSIEPELQHVRYLWFFPEGPLAPIVDKVNIPPLTIESDMIELEAILTKHIDDLAVNEEKLADAAVALDKIKDGAVDTDKLADAAVEVAKIADGAVLEAKLANNAVTVDKIKDGVVEASKIKDGAVSSDKLAALAVTLAKIANGAVDASKIAAAAVTGTKIAANAITAAKIMAGAISTAKLAANAITAAKIAAGTITASEIAAGAISTVKLAADAVTAAKIAAGTITASEIAAGAITTVELAAGAVTAEKIAAGAIEAQEIGAGTITAVELAAGAVTTAKLAAGAITADTIAANAITADKIATNAITAIKVNAGAITAAKVSAGAITATKIATNAITAAKISAGAVTANEIASNAVTTAKVNANAINTNELAAGAVTANNIGANAVIASKIIASAVTTAKLASGAVTADKIAAGTITADKIAAGVISNIAVDFSTIPDDTITSDMITDASIIADKIAANAVIAAKIATNAVSADKIAANAIDATKISAGAITAVKMAASSIDLGSAVVSGTLTADHIAADVINIRRLWAGSVRANTGTGSNEVTSNTDIEIYSGADANDAPYRMILATCAGFNFTNVVANAANQSVLYVIDTTRALEVRYDFSNTGALVDRTQEHEEFGAADIPPLTVQAIFAISYPSGSSGGTTQPPVDPPAGTAPPVPTSLGSTERLDGRVYDVIATYTGSNQADNYDIQYQTGGASSSASWSATTTIEDETATNRQILNNVALGTHYRFRVRASNDDGDSAYSNWYTDRVPTALPAIPDVPTGLTHSTFDDTDNPGQTIVLGEWDASDRATSYDVEHATGGTSTTPRWGNTVSTNGVTNDLFIELGSFADNTHFRFRVRANSASGTSAWTTLYVGRVGTSAPVAVTPVAPTSLSSSENRDGNVYDVTGSWNQPTGAVNYDIQSQTGGTGTDASWGTVTTSSNVTGTSHEIFSNLALGTHYRWRIRAKNTAGNSAYSTYEEGRVPTSVPTTAPTGVPSLSSTSDDDSVTLSWADITRAAQYRIAYGTGTTRTTAGTRFVVTSSLSRTITGLRASTTYYFWIQAFNDVGAAAWSGRHTKATTAPAVTIPAVPSGLGVTTSYDSGTGTRTIYDIRFTFSLVTGATSYDVNSQESTNGGSTWFNSRTHNVTASGEDINLGLFGNRRVRFRVRAKNSAGNSAYSSYFTKSGVIGPPVTATPAAPPPPTGLDISFTANGSNYSVSASWSAAARATSYDIQYSNSASTSFPANSSANTSSTSRSLYSSVAPLRYIRFRVRAKNSGGNSAWSGYRQERAPAAALTAPSAAPGSLSETETAGTSTWTVSVSFGAVARATSYTVDWEARAGASGAYSRAGLNSGSSRTRTIYTNLAQGWRYRWRVRGTNSAGNGPYSAWQNDSVGTITQPLGIPGGLAIVTTYDRPGTANRDIYDIRFAFSTVSRATSYNIQTQESTNGTTWINTRNYTVTASRADVNLELFNNRYVRFRVRARNSTQVGSYSDYKEEGPIAAARTLGVPGNLSVTTSYDSGSGNRAIYDIRFNFSTVTDAASYDVNSQESTDGGSTWFNSRTHNVDSSGEDINLGLFGNRRVRFRVRAKNSARTGSYSSYHVKSGTISS